jgi:hypothetical protein
MGGGDLEDLSSKKLIRKISDSLTSLLHPLFIDHGHPFKDRLAISTRRAGGLITVVLLEEFDEAIQFPVIHLDKFTHFQVEHLFKFGNLHDVHVLWFDEIFEVNRCEGPFPWQGKEIQEVSIVTTVFISFHVLEKERGLLKSLGDFEMLVPDRLIMGNILWPYPGRFQKLYRVRQLPVKTEVTRILEVTVVFFLSFPGGMAIMINMFVIVGTLPEAYVVDDQFEITSDGLPDRF